MLRNRLGITDPDEMARVEQRLLRQLHQAVLRDPACLLSSWHGRWMGNIYSWAGAQLLNALSSAHVELILIHPFREGNGRIARLLCDVMAVQAEIGPLDYTVWDHSRDCYFSAIRAGLGRDLEPMKQLFRRALPSGD